MLPEHAGELAQGFVLDSGDRFAAGTAAQFLANHRALEHGSQIPDGVKAGIRTRCVRRRSTTCGNHDATFDVRVQLCTDFDRMPVEDASAE